MPATPPQWTYNVTAAGISMAQAADATAQRTLLNVEDGATADQSDAEIAAAYATQVGQVSGGEITAGTETALRTYSPADVKSFVDTHAGGGGDLSSTDIDTLAKLNAIITDATLIDTGDSRLSDARAPTAHAANHTNGTDDIQSATNAQKGLATAAQITALEAATSDITLKAPLASPSFTGTVTLTTATVRLSTETTATPSGTTATITLNNGNHQTLDLSSSTGDVTTTFTVPSSSSAGTLILKQHGSTARDITWAVSAGTVSWMGTEPTWNGDAVSAVRIISWRYNGSVMYLAATDAAT